MHHTRRICLSILTLLALLSAPLRAETWRIIVLPDTQNYTNLDHDFDMDGTSDWLYHFTNQVNWVVANREAMNIVFVTHCGDLVEHVEVTLPAEEWMDADQVMSILDGIVPYGAVAGNHDILNSGLFPFNYIQFFGPSRYAGYNWYGGSSANSLNHYQKFQVNGDYGRYYFANISMQWQLPGDRFDPSTPMGWVQKVIDREGATNNILITTHAMIDVDGSFGTETYGLIGENTPEQVMNELLRPNFRRLDLIFSGHYHQPGDGMAQSYVRNVPVLMANYQEYPEGGSGYLRIIEFVEGGGTTLPDAINVYTYSPSLDSYMTDPENQFSFDYDFIKQLNPQPAPTPLPRNGRGLTPP